MAPSASALMGGALLAARLLLAAVFAVAGVAKAADRRATRQALGDFGAPAALVPLLAVLLPLGELSVAVALLVVPWAWYGAVGAAALLAIFTAAIGVSLMRGRKPDCHCFGQISSRPIGWTTLLRNLLLAAIAGFVVSAGRESPGPSAVGWLAALGTRDRVLLVGGLLLIGVVVAQAAVLLQLFTRHGGLLLRIEALEAALAGAMPRPASAAARPAAGLPVGSRAPAFALSGVHGEMLTLDALRAQGRPVLLIFSDPGCGPCLALMPEAGRWQHDLASRLTLAVVSRGTPEQNRAKFGEHGVSRVLLQKDREVAEDYRVSGTPSAVLVRPDGTIGSAAVPGAEAIRQLVAQASGAPVVAPDSAGALPVVRPAAPNGNGASPRAPTGPKRGDPAPPVALPDLDGRPVTLRAMRGKPTAVLFWNPACGFCQQMVGDLKAWEESRGPGAPELLVVSTGDVAANRAMGLRSTVVLDPSFDTMRAFGANGTPSAILVDARGRLASELGVGRAGVLALLGASPAAPSPAASGAAPRAR